MGASDACSFRHVMSEVPAMWTCPGGCWYAELGTGRRITSVGLMATESASK